MTRKSIARIEWNGTHLVATHDNGIGVYVSWDSPITIECDLEEIAAKFGEPLVVDFDNGALNVIYWLRPSLLS